MNTDRPASIEATGLVREFKKGPRAVDGIDLSVAPGEIATPMTSEPEQDAYAIERPGNPIGRPGHVNEVASVIGFLASPRASYVTGTSVTVDGGLSNMAAHGHDKAEPSWRQV